MPVYEYVGDTPQSRPNYTADAAGNLLELAQGIPVSDPIDYTMEGEGAPEVKGRRFEKGERVAAAANPDPSRFNEV